MKNDDSDMKIAGVGPPREPADNGEETARLLAREKACGNLQRARRLGAIMAEDVAAAEGGQPLTQDSAQMYQRRILLAFAVEVGLDAFLPNSLLAQTAQSVFYDTLQATAPSFFEDLQESGAFSFYYLRVREGRDVEKRVGETYATLCGRAGDDALAKAGAELYTRFIRQVRSLADSMDFVCAG